MNDSKVNMISPKKILSVSGRAQRASDSGPFTLANGSASEPASQATIVFDYGRRVGGLPVIAFESAQGKEPIRLRVAYSETIEGVDCETGERFPNRPFHFPDTEILT